MKRRKTFNKKRAVCENVAFDFYINESTEINVTNVFGCDFYKITFGAPIADGYMRVTHIPSNRQDVTIALRPDLYVDDKGYRSYETHTISNDGKTMYIALENTNTNGADDKTLILRPVFDFGIAFQPRFKRLAFVPPDQMLNIKASRVPQHNPLWMKSRGKLTSSVFTRYLGYFIPDPESEYTKEREKAKTWTLKTKDEFTGWTGARVRFGSIKECEVIAAYLNYYKDRRIEQTGYHTHPDNKEWGASPDALVWDKNNELRTLEIKSSMSVPTFSGYFIPQVLWQMATLGVNKGDLVRYCEKSQNDSLGRTKTMRIATLVRNHQLEEKLTEMALAVQAAEKANDVEKFKELVFSPEYRKMRATLDEMAKNLKYEQVQVTENDEMIAYRAKKCNVEIPNNCPRLDDIEKRQCQIADAFNENNKRELTRLTFEQIRDYTALLEEK